MTPASCEQLERYLDCDLVGERREEFEAHLQGCAACRGEVARAERLSELLARAAMRLEAVPDDLADRIERHVRLRLYRRRAMLVSGVAAAVAACVLVWQLATPAGPQPAGEPTAQAQAQAVPTARPPLKTEVTFADPSRVIAVPVETANPSITFVWVYPTVVPAEQHNAPEPDSTPDDARNPL
jgi:anti-sigma factor RsiW